MSDKAINLGPMRPWVEAQIAAGRFANEAHAVQAALVNLASHDARTANLQALVREGLDDLSAGRIHDYDSAEAMMDDILTGST